MAAAAAEAAASNGGVPCVANADARLPLLLERESEKRVT